MAGFRDRQPGVLTGTAAARPAIPPISPVFYFATDTGALSLFQAGAWSSITVGAGASVATDPIWTATGQIVQATGAAAATALNIGTAGQALRVNAGATALAYADFVTAGTIAARPAAAAGNTGSLYFATDIAGGQLYRSTGAAWVPQGPSTPVSLSAVTTFTGTGQAGGTDVTLWTPFSAPSAMWAIGTRLDIRLDMDFDTVSSATARNFVFKVAIGATVLWSGTVIVPTTVALANQSAILLVGITCYATGAGGSVRSQGQVVGIPTGLGLAIKQMENASTGTNVVAVDLSAARAITLTVNESVNSVAEVIRAQAGHAYVLNPA